MRRKIRIAVALMGALGVALVMTAIPAQSASRQASTGNYGVWAWSQGDMPQSIASGTGSTLAEAEATAVQACQMAGGGSECYARDWFENAYSSFAYDASGNYWGVSDATSSADADSLALSACSSQSGATDCGIVDRATANPTSTPGGAVLPATPSYGVWAISPSTHIAAFGIGDTITSAQQAAAGNCETAGGLATECEVYGGWALNGYSAIYMGANDTWSISNGPTPARANYLAQHECQTVKAVGLACTLMGSNYTVDPWVAQTVGWIDQPTTLPTQPSLSFTCVTGPQGNGSCLQPGAGVPSKDNLGPMPPGWLTSAITGGCVIEFIPGLDVLDLLTDIGSAVQIDNGTGLWIVRLAGTAVDNCTQLLGYILARKPIPQGLDSHGTGLRQSGNVLDSAVVQNLFRPLPKSQLASLKTMPFLSQRFGYAVAQIGSVAAISQKYRTGTYKSSTYNSMVCHRQHNGYKCDWSLQLNGATHAGYVLIAVTANGYHLSKVVQVVQVPNRSTALNPLWYAPIGAAALAVIIVIAMLARRRHRTRKAQLLA